ncbi:MAG: thioredoxin domain-containing protein, partial [Candidatus Eremiobacteraeota bacterium]|nr:thioredoxin domain-containing protein [Candidatus Eremiobacteraeota bacterium]
MSSEGDAAAIRWEPWSAAAFERARAEEKPILLGISAVWCHWCHVMDRTTYRDETVISLVNERFVPVRVDNDERPDVNARYNMGGWPSTVFLAADGTILTGATYVPPANMTGLLRDIDRFYRERRGEIADRIAEIAATRDARAALRSESAPDEACIDWTIETLVAAYDDEYGGFGTEQKFPHVDALEFLVQEYRVTGQPRLYEMVAKSVAAMASGGMYDHVEGGFFRYSTTRDWSVPHFEKMAEDHAGLLRVLSTLVQISDRTDFRDTLRSATSYVREVLYDERLQRFAGSQDADEAYYALPLEARRATPAPFVDRRAYANWNAALAGAFFSAGVALEDDRLIGVGTAVLDGMHATMLDGDGLLFHVAAPGEHPRIRGLLTDQTAYVRAALDAHEGTGEARFLERARA